MVAVVVVMAMYFVVLVRKTCSGRYDSDSGIMMATSGKFDGGVDGSSSGCNE